MTKVELATKADIDTLETEIEAIDETLTESQYTALPTATKNNGTTYFVS